MNIIKNTFSKLKLSQKLEINLIQKSCFSSNSNNNNNDNLPEQNNEQSNIQNLTDQQIQQQLQEKAKQLKVKSYEIQKPGNVYNPKSNINPTRGVFDFSEEFLTQKSYIMQVFGLGNGYFSVNDVWYPGSIVVFQRQIFLWDMANASDIRPHSLDLLDVLKPFPDYIIIGTGKEKYEINQEVYQRFKDKKINVDILPTFEACSTFNVCAEDNMNVAAFLIPANM